MKLHRNLGNTKVVGDLLVETAHRYLAHDLAFARRQRRKTFDMLLHDLGARALGDIAFETRGDGVEQGLIAHRLGQKIDRTRFHRLDGHRNVAMPGEEDDRFSNPRRRKMLLKIEAARSGHADVEHQAARAIEYRRLDQLARRSVTEDRKSTRLNSSH